MDSLRTLIQETLEEISYVSSGVPMPDELIEDGRTYFGYSLTQDYIDSDFDRNYSMQASINGYLGRKNNNLENTVLILDTALEDILTALKSLNFRYNFEDVTMDRNIRKIHITGYVKYSEINYWLI